MTAKILHLSDIHFQMGSESEHDPDAPYRDKMMERIQASAGEAPFDFIFVTGDVANRGGKDEYAIAKDWLDRMASLARCSTQGVYVVPGNHDVDRSVSRAVLTLKTAQASVLSAPHEAAREGALRELMADETMGPALFRHLEAYNAFAAHYRSEVGPAEHGRWVRTAALDHGYSLKIFGLNSVLFSSAKPPGDDDARAQNLYVGPFQTTFRVGPHEIGVALIHHPPDWLIDGDLHGRKLKNDVRLQFMGHKHDRDVDLTQDYARFGAGAVSPNRHEPGFEPGFNIIELGVEATATGFDLKVSAEVWAWQENPGRFRLHQNRAGAERWTTSFPLQPIPADTDPMPGADRAPPPAPDLGGGHGPHVQRFWELSSGQKRMIATTLDLLTDDEKRLPERYRYTNIFKRAAKQDKLEQLIEMIRQAGEG